MSEPAPNLFNALFDFHPRDNHTPKENFLSEGFAYVLKTSKPARDAWLSEVLKRKVESSDTEIFTRIFERLGKTGVFPDMLIDAKLQDGKSVRIYSEHKWDAICDPVQLQNYFDVAIKSSDACVIFIGSTHKQLQAARKVRLGSEKKELHGCFLWEQVFQTLNAVSKKDEILSQFLDFMKTHGLNPGERLTLEKMQAYLLSNDFEQSLMRATEKLSSEHEWNIIPARFHPHKQVTNRFGRIAIEFAAPGWKPTITVGFLIETLGHRVVFTNQSKGIDLLLRIEAMPELLRSAEPALVALRKKVPDLKKEAASVLLVGERGNGNGHSLLLVRTCLWDVIEGAKTESEQLECVYNRLNSWLTILFEDGELERSFKASGLDGGL